ncbi:MAG: TetR/AcrR family transcriptional regulator [bacterium]
MPKIVDESERKNDIADAAVKVFAQSGFSETTVQQIADQADMSKGNIYRYFDSKEEVLQQIFLNFEQAIHETLDVNLSREDDPANVIQSLITDLTTLVRSNRPTIKVLFDFWSYSLHNPDENFIDHDSFYKKIQRKLRSFLDDGASKGVFHSDWNDELPSMLIGFFEGQLIQWLVNPSSPSLSTIRNTGTQMLLTGLLDDGRQLT